MKMEIMKLIIGEENSKFLALVKTSENLEKSYRNDSIPFELEETLYKKSIAHAKYLAYLYNFRNDDGSRLVPINLKERATCTFCLQIKYYSVTIPLPLYNARVSIEDYRFPSGNADKRKYACSFQYNICPETVPEIINFGECWTVIYQMLNYEMENLDVTKIIMRVFLDLVEKSQPKCIEKMMKKEKTPMMHERNLAPFP